MSDARVHVPVQPDIGPGFADPTRQVAELCWHVRQIERLLSQVTADLDEFHRRISAELGAVLEQALLLHDQIPPTQPAATESRR